MSKGTLLFYINSLGKGGAERVITQLAYRFSLEGYRAILITSFVADDEYEVPGGVERISIEKEQIEQSRLKRNVSRICALRKLCKEYRPLALISFMGEPNFRAVLATMGLNIKTIISVRNDPDREYHGRIWRFVATKILPLADGCVFQTEDAKRWFPQKLQVKSEIIPNEVADVFFQTEYIGGNDIVTIGRLNQQKNQALLIKAFAKVADCYKDVSLKIYGAGNLKSELQALIEELNMSHRIKLMGTTTCPDKVLATAGLFVLSSDYEGMPNALMEALTVGVPCISTDCPCGGPRMIIDHGISGLLVPVADEPALVNAMKRILDNKEERVSLGMHGKEKSLLFYPDKVFIKWKTYIEYIITG